MGDENKVRDAADAVRGVLEAVPIYEDALQPAAKELGSALGTVAKAIHVALAPVSALVWGFEKIKAYLAEALPEKLKDVPPERIITPSPSVAVPTLEALRYSAHEPSLRELYANLLATSMDEQTALFAHPAFVESIKQMTPDEALIIEFLSTSQTFPMITVGVGFDILNLGVVHAERLLHFSSIANESRCSHPNLWPTYLNNLSRLGLVEIKEGAVMGGDEIYKALQNHPTVKEFVSEIETGQLGFAASRSEFLQLTELGNQFCRACVA
ncbi:MAG TPA: DUF4393 domain-containing protein [Pyrinomonadaceae bacterium]|nr:DUF4393 domain-containing protein [Pyrinomonadaceae bacterium]